MVEMVPVKIKIRRGVDGKMQYPKFNVLASSIRKGLDWSHYFDTHGLSWHYDKLSGLGESDLENPEVDNAHEHANSDTTSMFGVTCLPEDFAVAAVAAFPEEVTIISEASFESFYDDRAHVHEETEKLDLHALQGLQARIALENDPNAPTVVPSAEILKLRAEMLDPASSRRGITRSKTRRWADYKTTKTVTIRASERAQASLA